MKKSLTSDVLARRFESAWHLYSLHRFNGDSDLAIAALRRWSRLRAALENAILADAAPAPEAPAFEFHRTDGGGAQVAVPVPAVIRRDLDSCHWRMHLDGQIGNTWGALAYAYHDSDPEVQQIGRDGLFEAGRNLAPLADFGRQPLELLHLALAPVAWQNFQLAADLSGVPVDRLLAGTILRRWTEGLFTPAVPGAIHGSLLQPSRHAA